jgi:3-oxoacyl-[acyl-carrier protein] reductase
MLMSTLDGVEFAPDYPELAGKRVLLTGLKGPLGVEVARAFADHKARLVLHACVDDEETQALAEIVAQSAMDVRLFTGSILEPEGMARLARRAVQCYGGLDAVINVAHVGEPPANASEATIERMVTDLLAMPCLVSRVAANRMKMTMTEGAIINIVAEGRDASPRRRLVAGIARSAVAAMTRTEARTWADGGIRINAIAPTTPLSSRHDCLNGDPDVASLALHLASGRGHKLSGLVFEAHCG